MKVAIVTGGGSGIGQAVAIRLAKGKWTVVLGGRRQKTLDETIALCKEQNPEGEYLGIPTDVCSESDVQNLFHQTVEKFGKVDLLFNNAGINAPSAHIADVSLEDFQRVIQTNVVGSFLCAREAVRCMKESGGGRIINNGSLSAQVPRTQSTCYSTSKHAITGLTKCIALDGRSVNVACGQIDFGNVVSQMSKANTSTGALQPNGQYIVEDVMQLEDAAETVWAMVNLPQQASILQCTLIASSMPFVGRG